MDLNTHIEIKKDVQDYLSTMEGFQEELVRLKEMKEELKETIDLTIDFSEPKDFLEELRRYEQRLKAGLKDPVMFMFRNLMTEEVLRIKKNLEQKLSLPLFTSFYDQTQLDEFLEYVLDELKELEFKLYSINFDEYDCQVCGKRNLVLDENRGERICKNCGTVSREKMIEEEITN